MMSNLNAEMARFKISKTDIASLLRVTEKTVSNKLNGETTFSIHEAFAIKNTFFPQNELPYLFATDDVQKIS